MKENSSKSPGSDGEIKNDDDKQQGEEGILQMVLGYSANNSKEAALRQKLLDKKAKLTEETLRKKLLEKRAQLQEESRRSPTKSRSPTRSPSPVVPKRKSKRKHSRSSSSSSESTPPKRKKKSSKHKKSKKKSKKHHDHMRNLSEKGVLHRVIIRHLNPQEESEKERKASKKQRSRERQRSGSRSFDNNSGRRHRSRSPRRTTTKNRSPPNKDRQTAKTETIVVDDDSPAPSPKIFDQYYLQHEEESTSYAHFEEGSIEAKPFEDLNDEEKATLSPTLLTFKESIYQKQLVAQLPIYYPGISGCRSVDEFQVLNRIEEGTFGVVYRALELRTDDVVALKRLKMEKEREGFPITSLREINMLMKCRKHPNVVNIREIVVGSTMDKIFLVMEYVDHDMKVLLKQMDERKKKFKISEIKTLMHQLLSGCAYLHSEWVLHRDLKTSNLLLTHSNVLKIGDFGLAREYGEPLKQYTPVVVTLWYRSPELLLGCKTYSTAIDVWSIGCIFGEFMHLRPIFQGSSETDQLNKIFMDTGVPNKVVWPTFDQLPGISRVVFANTPYNQLRKKFMADLKSETGLDLMNKLLTLDPSKRVSAKAALTHPFFGEEPKPASLDSFPTWPSKSETKTLVPTRLNPVEIDAKSNNGFSLNLGKQK